MVEAVHEIVKKTANDAIQSPSVNKPAIPTPSNASPPLGTPTAQTNKIRTVEETCVLIGEKLGSVETNDCLAHHFVASGGVSVNGTPILLKEYPPLPGRESRARILLLGGLHGDEYSAISIVFKWMEILNKFHSGMFHWHVVPLVNPDGLLQKNSRRQNTHDVDLNRNFPTSPTLEEWLEASQNYWINETHRDPRRFPGTAPLSEPESRWIAEEIARFKPDAVVSVHAPYGLLDFDGPPNTPPERLGQLYLSLLGTYPGSLGRYCGDNIKIPIITIELQHAGILPEKMEITDIWMDLVKWLTSHVQRRIPPESSSKNSKARSNFP
ncbi:MAG: peptidase M14, carboxypeptidase A [Magnetococcales bacterium]|nr:peptidase M14, carboxypeptidase A [Magnetococcales bacterium]HIJ84517.1 murein peptide amidase A [Magnetococcales bacterium]